MEIKEQKRIEKQRQLHLGRPPKFEDLRASILSTGSVFHLRHVGLGSPIGNYSHGCMGMGGVVLSVRFIFTQSLNDKDLSG